MPSRPSDDSPNSVFVQEMRAAFAKRLLASGVHGKREVDREIEGIMRTCLGRSAWDVAREVGATTPRATRATRRVRPGPSSRYREGFDHKLAQAGEREDED